jgi:protein SCO1/2
MKKMFFEKFMIYCIQKFQSILLFSIILGTVLLCFPRSSRADFTPSKYQSKAEKSVGVDEHLGKKLNLSLVFTNEKGEEVALSSVFKDDKPILLTLNYYSCNTLCSAQLNSLLEGLKELDWKPGKEFRMLTVSIDPDETSELAKEKKRSYLEALGNPEADWNFWVGRELQITSLADAVGFRYAYDPVAKQYAHPAVSFFVSGDGVISRYLYGLTYSARDIKFSLIETTQGRVGSPIEKLIMSCFSYDTSLGKYTPTAFGIMRLGGVFSLVGIAVFLLVMWRREIKRKIIPNV